MKDIEKLMHEAMQIVIEGNRYKENVDIECLTPETLVSRKGFKIPLSLPMAGPDEKELYIFYGVGLKYCIAGFNNEEEMKDACEFVLRYMEE